MFKMVFRLKVLKVLMVKVVIVKIKKVLEEALEDNKIDKVVQEEEIVLQILKMLLITNVKRKDISFILV